MTLASKRNCFLTGPPSFGDADAPASTGISAREAIYPQGSEADGRHQIFFCGDVHGSFEHIIEAVSQNAPVAVILLGDIQALKPLEQELAPILNKTSVWFIPGNHDTDSDADYDNLFGSALAERNLHGRVVNIAGVRIAGLGGVFRGKVWAPPASQIHASAENYLTACAKANLWRGGLPRKHRSSIFPQDYFRLAEQRADVLVSHEAPSVHPHGFTAIEDLAQSLKVGKSFHGHHHDRLDYSAHRAELGFEAYGVGFCGITDLNGKVIRVGDFDGVRKNRTDYDEPKKQS